MSVIDSSELRGEWIRRARLELERQSGNRAGIRAGAAIGTGGFVNGAFIVNDGECAARASIDTGAATDAVVFVNINGHGKLLELRIN